MLDIFKNDAFSVINLTDAINQIKFVPSYVSSLGIFAETPVDTTVVGIEAKGDQLILVPPSARGAPGTTTDKTKRNLRPFFVPHFEINDAVMAEEVQGVRAFGQEKAVETLQGKLAERFGQHQRSFSATEEYARIGAVKGVVTYADGSTLDLFDEFGVSQQTELAFALATKDGGALRTYVGNKVFRAIGNEMGGLPWTGAVALCSDSFFDALLTNPEIYKSYLNQQEAKELRTGYVAAGAAAWAKIDFGGMTWVNYRGAVGTTKFVDDDKCAIFPVGSPGLFRSYYGPADYIETVNTPGKRLYAKQYEMPNGKGINLDVQTNALHICTRPRVLLKGKLQA